MANNVNNLSWTAWETADKAKETYESLTQHGFSTWSGKHPKFVGDRMYAFAVRDGVIEISVIGWDNPERDEWISDDDDTAEEMPEEMIRELSELINKAASIVR